MPRSDQVTAISHALITTCAFVEMGDCATGVAVVRTRLEGESAEKTQWKKIESDEGGNFVCSRKVCIVSHFIALQSWCAHHNAVHAPLQLRQSVMTMGSKSTAFQVIEEDSSQSIYSS